MIMISIFDGEDAVWQNDFASRWSHILSPAFPLKTPLVPRESLRPWNLADIQDGQCWESWTSDLARWF